MQIVLFFFLENFSLFFFNTRIVKSFHFFLIRFEIKTARVFASGIVSTGNSRAFSAIRSLSLFRRSSDHTIVVSTTREINHLFSSALLSLRSFLSLAPHVLLSLVRTPSLTCKQAYKHALAHADTQKCPTNTHSRNFSELRYLDKNITAV